MDLVGDLYPEEARRMEMEQNWRKGENMKSPILISGSSKKLVLGYDIIIMKKRDFQRSTRGCEAHVINDGLDRQYDLSTFQEVIDSRPKGEC